jgi:endonuclease/exonuclease/phosphatase (EEP) superfamily protein YafD
MKIFLIFFLLTNVSWGAGKESYGKASSFRGPTKNEKIIIFSHPKKHQDSFGETINLLVWNIFLGQKKELPSMYKDFVQGKDLVLTQEFYLTDLVKKLFMEDTDRGYVLSTAYVYKKGEILSGVATASTVESIKNENFYSKFKEPITSVHKSSLFTYFKLKNGKTLLVVNVHTVNFVFGNEFGEQVFTIEKEMKKHKGPLILAGDFNTYSYGKIKMLNLIAYELKLKEIDYGTPDRRKTFLQYPLDHVYYRELKLTKSEVLESNKGSDHNAISVIFTTI